MPSSADEQYLLELIDDARLDPVGDARRYISSFDPIGSRDAGIDSALKYFGVDGSAFLQALSGLQPAQPLAFNDSLAAAARGHDARMIADDSQSHQLPGEGDIGQRARAVGYTYRSLGENIFAYSKDPLYAHAGFMVDWGSGPGGLQPDAGHRTNVMDPDFREAGVGIAYESDARTAVGPQVTTEDLGTSGASGTFILGVAYDDLDGDGFYSVGEGVAGLSVSVDGTGTSSSDSGGYTLKTAETGRHTIVLSGGGLSGDVTVRMDLHDGLNAKLDVVDGHILRTSVPVDVSGPVDAIVGLGLGASGSTLDGGPATDTAAPRAVYGTSGDDVLTGTAGPDRFVFRRNGGQDEITDFRLSGGSHDLIDLSGFPGLHDVAQLMHHVGNVDGQAVIHLGSTSLTLDGIGKGALARHPADFIFHG